MTAATSSVSQEELVAFADMRLDATRTAEIEHWLVEHPDAAGQIDAWRRQTTLLKSALDPVMTAPVPQALTQALTRHAPRRWIRPAVAAAVAAIVFFPAGLGAGWFLWNRSATRELDRLVQSGIALHRIYVVEVRHPVEVTADDQNSLLAWLTKRIDAPVKAPNLDGLKLLGGRLVPSSDGRPAAMLMYEGDTGERFTLIMEHTTTSRMAALHYVAQGAVASYYWVDGDIAYSLNGPAEKKRLWNIARAAYDQLD